MKDLAKKERGLWVPSYGLPSQAGPVLSEPSPAIRLLLGTPNVLPHSTPFHISPEASRMPAQLNDTTTCYGTQGGRSQFPLNCLSLLLCSYPPHSHIPCHPSLK